ncbi:MAG: NADP-dependent oxidoreductase [Thaumarchaeota archaeon]|nr:NADP-dependent oxidoreductase [Nitrososphaerota archaeon]
MRAAQFSRYGGPEVIELNAGAGRPTLVEGQILVKSHASSINPIDWNVRAGYLQKMLPLTFPVTLGGDFAGVVADVTQGVSSLRVGDRVYGFAPVFAGGSGAMAESVAANAAMVARAPARTSDVEAAALPLAGVSAVQALEDHLKVGPGQRVLIHGGAGGVGSFAIQYAKILGCYVATTVRGSQEEFVRMLGADVVVNFEADRFEAILKDYDAVIDTVGGDVYKSSFGVLKKGGIVASFVQNPPDQELATKFGARTVTVATKVDSNSLGHLAELVDRGSLKAHVGREYPIGQTRAAFTYFEQDHPIGKVVVRIE